MPIAAAEARKEPEHLNSYELSFRTMWAVCHRCPQQANAGTGCPTTVFHLTTKACHLVTRTR